MTNRYLIAGILTLLGGSAQAQQSTPVASPVVAAAAASLAVTTVSAAGGVALPAATTTFPALKLTNDGSVTVFYALGSASVTATTGGIPILPGQCVTDWGGQSSQRPGAAPTNIAAITATGSSTLRVSQANSLQGCGGAPGAVTVTPSGTQDENLTQVGGVTLLRGAGATGTGSQRVTTAQDATTVAGSAPGTAGTPSTNVVSIQGVASGTPLLTKSGTITWVASTSGTVTTTATVVAAGPTVSVITNTTAAGGGALSLSFAGGTATNGAGVVLQPGQIFGITGQPTGTAITGVCSTGTCSFGVQSGS